MISLGLSRAAYSDYAHDLRFFVAGLLATIVTAMMVYVCFAYSNWIERVLGRGGTEIAVRLSAFILFCIGVQIIWTGASELLRLVIAA
jgi:multiple antibiotic resistance protein